MFPRSIQHLPALNPLITLLAVALIAACAPHPSVTRGDAMRKQGNLRAALLAYEEAKRQDPDDADVERRLSLVRSEIVEQSLVKARQSMALRHFGSAAQAIADAQDLSLQDGQNPDSIDDFRRIKSDFAAAIQGHSTEILKNGAPLESSVALFEDLLLAQYYLPQLRDPLKATEVALGEALLRELDTIHAKERFTQAYTVAQNLAEKQSPLQSEFAKRRDRIAQDWSATLKSTALKHLEGNEPAQALADWLVIRWLGTDPQAEEHIEALHRQVAQSVEVHLYLGSTQTGSAQDLPEPGAESTSHLGGIPLGELLRPAQEVVLHTTASAPLRSGVNPYTWILNLTPETTLCDNHESTRSGAHRYVAGHEEVPNPEKARLIGRFRELEAERDERIRELSRLEDRMALANRQLRQLARQQDSVTNEYHDVEEQERKLDALYDKLLRDAPRRDDYDRFGQEADRRFREDQRRHQNRIDQMTQQRGNARQTLSALRTTQKNIHREKKRAERHLVSLQRDIEWTSSQLGFRERLMGGVEGDILATPDTVLQEIWATYTYPIHTVERICSQRVTLRRLEKQSGESTTYSIESKTSTKDVYHAPNTAIGLDEDPFQLPKTDATLQGEMDRDLQTQFQVLLNQWRDAHFDQLLRTSAKAPREQSLRLLFGTAAWRPEHMGVDDRERLILHIQNTHDVLLSWPKLIELFAS